MIQYSDVNVGPASYKNLPSDVLRVTKIFYTIQGEGPHAGTPAIFVRLAGCNRGRKEDMGCQFCDTNFLFAEGHNMTFDQILGHMVRLMPPTMLMLVVITGGEPMMQDNVSAFIRFLYRQEEIVFDIQIESNGDRLAADLPLPADLVVSPKVTRGAYHALRPDVLVRADYLKFVVDADPTGPYHNVPAYTKEKAPSQIYLSPLTVYKRAVDPREVANFWDPTLMDRPAMQANFKRVAELVLKYGYRASHQSHLLWNLE